MLNLDKKYANQIFTIVIFEDDLDNFPVDIERRLKNKLYCFTGKVTSFKEKPQIIVNNESQVKEYLRQ